MVSKTLFSSEKQDWETPQYLFDELDKEFNFHTDVASSNENAKCVNYVDEQMNALTMDWSELGNIFCNPPYDNKVQNQFVEKAYEESLKTTSKIVLLIPSRTDTARWHNHILGKAEVRFIKGRLKFESTGVPHENPAPFPTAIIIYN